MSDLDDSLDSFHSEDESYLLLDIAALSIKSKLTVATAPSHTAATKKPLTKVPSASTLARNASTSSLHKNKITRTIDEDYSSMRDLDNEIHVSE